MAERGQGEVIGVFFFPEVNALHAEVRFRLAKFFVGGVASKRQPPRKLDLLIGSAGLLGQAIGQGFALAVGEMIVQYCEGLGCNGGDLALSATGCGVVEVEHGH